MILHCDLMRLVSLAGCKEVYGYEHLYSPIPLADWSNTNCRSLHSSEDDALGTTHCRLALGCSVQAGKLSLDVSR